MARSSSRNRVRLELDAPVGIELLDRVDEAEDPVAHKVGALDRVGHARQHPAGYELHERRVVEDEAVPGRMVRAPAVLVPELSDRLDPVDVYRHQALGCALR
jgi:hypothetical protein